MKIAIFHLAFIYSGGGEKLVLEEARGLKALGHHVEIFVPVINRKKCFPDILKRFEIKTFLPALPFILPEHESFQILLTSFLAPLLAIRFRKFDVILAANQPSPWIAWWVKKFFKVAYVSYLAQPTRFLYPRQIDKETGFYFAKKAADSLTVKIMHRIKNLITWADNLSIRGSNLVLANGEYVKNLLDSVYKIKSVSLPAGAQRLNKIKSYGSRLKGKFRIGRMNLTKPYLLITNRHFAQKRFEHGVLALSSLLQKFPEYSLYITGQETTYTNEVKLLVERLNLKERVKFLGYVKDESLEVLYANASIYLYTAPQEDFGMGIIEAMLSGTPVVAWAHAGPEKILINGKEGFLAKPFEVSDFSEKVLKIVSDRNLAESLALRALKKAKEKYTFEKHFKKLEDVLKKRVDEVNN